MKQRFVVVALTAVTLTGCALPFSQSDSTASVPTTESTTPGSATAGQSVPEDTAVPTTETPDTTPAAPLDIAETLVRPTDATVVGILTRGQDPSPVDGDAIPWRPDAHCAFATEARWRTRSEVIGCEFGTEAAAADYLQQWLNAFTNPAPVWLGQPATASRVDTLPDWQGRAVSGRGAYYNETFALDRVDLVQQRGVRVYTVTVVSDAGGAAAAATQAVDLAESQQEKLDELGVAADTAAGAVDTAPGHLSVRYLVPTWDELRALAPNMTGVPEETMSASRTAADYHVAGESYSRALTAVERDEWNSVVRLAVTIQRNGDPGESIRSVLYAAGMRCMQPAAPIDGVPDGVSCSTDDDFRFAVRHGSYVLIMEAPAAVDFAAAQQVFVQWNQRLLDTGVPTDAAIPVRDLLPRSANPLPTDSFPLNGYDDSYQRTEVYTSVKDGRYVSAFAKYDRTPGQGVQAYQDDEYSVSIQRADSEMTSSWSDAELVGPIGEVTADAWTTVIWRTFSDSDSTSFDGVMARLLPSGDRLEVRDSMMFIVGQQVQADPPFAADGPLLTSVWDSLQGFSLDAFTADDDDVVSVRASADLLASEGDLTARDNIIPLEAGVAPDSPPGTNAEWRVIWPQYGGDQPEAQRRVIAFVDDAAASAHVATITGGVALPPIVGAPEIEGGSNAEAGLIVLRRGKWVVTMSSPGRTNWGTSVSPALATIGIEQYATYLAQFFVSTGLI